MTTLSIQCCFYVYNYYFAHQFFSCMNKMPPTLYQSEWVIDERCYIWDTTEANTDDFRSSKQGKIKCQIVMNCSFPHKNSHWFTITILLDLLVHPLPSSTEIYLLIILLIVLEIKLWLYIQQKQCENFIWYYVSAKFIGIIQIQCKSHSLQYKYKCAKIHLSPVFMNLITTKLYTDYHKLIRKQ